MQSIKMSLFELDLLCDACDTYITESAEEDLPEEFKESVIANTEKIRSKLMAAARQEMNE